MGRYDELDKLVEKAVDLRIKKKHYEQEYNKIRKEIEKIMEDELYATEYRANSGTIVRITVTKRKQINTEKIKELLEIARSAGYDVSEKDIYVTTEVRRFEILTPQDLERRRKFARGEAK